MAPSGFRRLKPLRRVAPRQNQRYKQPHRRPRGGTAWQERHSENGAALSGGERQRLSIARALLKDAPVVLLDEATASLDTENETLIQRAVGALCTGKTVIVIAHRLRTIANADKIVVLDDGNIVEEGAHNDLVSSNGLYRHLWDLQLRSSSWGANGRMAAEGAQ